jgi:hypothetical protein
MGHFIAEIDGDYYLLEKELYDGFIKEMKAAKSGDVIISLAKKYKNFKVNIGDFFNINKKLMKHITSRINNDIYLIPENVYDQFVSDKDNRHIEVWELREKYKIFKLKENDIVEMEPIPLIVSVWAEKPSKENFRDIEVTKVTVDGEDLVELKISIEDGTLTRAVIHPLTLTRLMNEIKKL